MVAAKQKFENILSEAKADLNIIGFFLGGSRGKGIENKFSDYDVYVIVENDKAEFCKKKYSKIADENFEFMIYSFNEFKNYAEWGSKEEWARYNCAQDKFWRRNIIKKLLFIKP